MAVTCKDWNPGPSSDHVAILKCQPGIVSPAIKNSHENGAILMTRNLVFILNNCTFFRSSMSFAGTTMQQTKADKEINDCHLQSFFPLAMKLWNSLPSNAAGITLERFKQLIKFI